MANNIVYTNEIGSVITEQQMSMLTNFKAVTYEDDVVKKIVEFGSGTDGNSIYVQYFMNASENKSEIIQTYADGKTGLEVYFNSLSQNGFTQWNWEKYSPEGALKLIGYRVYNNNNWEIMQIQLDPITKAIRNRGVKYYFGNQYKNQYEDLLLVFNYNADGTIDSISDFNNTYGFGQGSVSSDYFTAYMQSIQQDFSWDQYPYFQSLTPYLPDSPVL